MVQREAAERFVANPRTPAYGAVSVKVAYWADGAHRRQRPGVGVRAATERRVVAGRDRAADPHRRPTRPSCFRSCVPGSASAARCCAARSTASSRPSSSRRPTSRPPAARRSSTCSRGAAWPTPSRQPRRHPMSTCRAHAKLTMSLHVTGVRDDGYHLIDAEMVSLELHDLLSFEPCDPSTQPVLTAIGPFADGVPTDGTNLVARALDLAGSPAVTTIDKRIPHGGGLGGGSTDAAAALRWGGFGTSRSELERAGRLGADIPFCLRRRARPRVRDRRSRRASPPRRPHGDARDPAAAREHPRGLPRVGRSRPAVRRRATNDLEAAAIVVEPDLARWRRLIDERIDGAPTLAGSGATWFVEGSFPGVGRPRGARRDGGGDAHGRRRTARPVPAHDRDRCTDVRTGTTCDAGDACDGASSCASSCACACDAS